MGLIRMIFNASPQKLICRSTHLLFAFNGYFWGKLSAASDLTLRVTEGADSLAGINPKGVGASHRKNKSPNLREKNHERSKVLIKVVANRNNSMCPPAVSEDGHTECITGAMICSLVFWDTCGNEFNSFQKQLDPRQRILADCIPRDRWTISIGTDAYRVWRSTARYRKIPF